MSKTDNESGGGPAEGKIRPERFLIKTGLMFLIELSITGCFTIMLRLSSVIIPFKKSAYAVARTINSSIRASFS